MAHSTLIAVVGEALIDLVVSADGKVAAQPGGGPYNTARTLARLGMPAVFVGRLAADGFGRTLGGMLTADGVILGVPQPSAAPSTLAVAEIDPDGAARYGFYLAGTAAADLAYPVLRAALPDGVAAVHAGTLGLVMEPIGANVERLITQDLPPDVLVMVDPNCRPAAIADRAAYLERFGRILRRADVVKVSVEDLDYLCPGVPPQVAAATLLGDKRALILVTDGPRPARAFMPGRALTAEVPEMPVVDTIGAGDAFGGAFLAWWLANKLTRDDLTSHALVGDGLRAAVGAASLTCGRVGADPPTLADLRALDRWPVPAR
jgi:fructokinase